jgi:hypothetical protein
MEKLDKRICETISIKEAMRLHKELMKEIAENEKIPKQDKKKYPKPNKNTHNTDLIYNCFDELLEKGEVLQNYYGKY